MRSDHAARVGDDRGDPGDRDGGRVRREHRVRRGDGVEPAEHLLLDVDVLVDGFHDERRASAALEVGSRCDAREGGVRVGSAHLVLGDEAVERVPHRVLAAIQGVARDVVQHDVVPRERRDLRDARTHETCTDHSK